MNVRPKRRPADRDRRSDRHADDADDRQPDNPHGFRVARPRGRSLGHARGLPRAHHSDDLTCSGPGSRLIPQSRVRPRDPHADGGDDHRADNRCGRCGARRDARRLGHVDAHDRHGLRQSRWSSDLILSVSKLRGHRGAALGRVVHCVADQRQHVLIGKSVENVLRLAPVASPDALLPRSSVSPTRMVIFSPSFSANSDRQASFPARRSRRRRRPGSPSA